jgi:hypothetical protein
MLIARGVLGGLFLLLGRELNFLISAGMAALIGFRLLPILPSQWPGWAEPVFVAALALIAAAFTLLKEEFGYVLSGFLIGAYFLVEYYEPGVLTLPMLPFIVGGIIGALVMGIFTEWALMTVSSLVGVYFVMDLFTVSPTAKTLIGAGLFIVGALTQASLMRMQKSSER